MMTLLLRASSSTSPSTSSAVARKGGAAVLTHITRAASTTTSTATNNNNNNDSTTCRRFTGKTAIVTASTDGIGYAIAKRLAQEGANVVISSRREKNVLKTVQEFKDMGLSVDGCVCHVGKEEQLDQLVAFTKERFGGIDVAVSNAAISLAIGPVLETSTPAWDKTFDINVKSAFLFAKAVMPSLIESQGNLLFVSSIAGYAPLAGLGAYSISKTALVGLTKTLSDEMGPLGVRVNCLAPGIIRTKFSKLLYEDDDVRTKLLESVPSSRLGEPSEMAASAAFLCSDDASYVTGETLLATGGMRARL